MSHPRHACGGWKASAFVRGKLLLMVVVVLDSRSRGNRGPGEAEGTKKYPYRCARGGVEVSGDVRQHGEGDGVGAVHEEQRQSKEREEKPALPAARAMLGAS